LLAVVIQIRDAIKSAGISERMVDGTLADKRAAYAVEETAGTLPVRGVEKVKSRLGAVDQEALDGVVVSSATEAGNFEYGVGALFTYRLSPLQ